jgi:hypothetical protein
MIQQPLFTARAISERALAFDKAADDWGLNCGPGAICGALALHPDEVRPHLGMFEHRARRYMSPSDMWGALQSLGVEYSVRGNCRNVTWPRSNGICRVQWGGPWCKPGKPPAAAYRHTHWIGAQRMAVERNVHGGYDDVPAGTGPVWIFDVNNFGLSRYGWLPEPIWAAEVVPELLPRNGDGQWWITHTAEIERL